MKVKLTEQIFAVELVLANRKGHIENLKSLIRAKKRPAEELEIAERPIAGLEAAIKTLKWVEANELRIKEALSRQGEA